MIRKTLADSYVAAVSIAILLLWSLGRVYLAMTPPLYGLIEYLINAIAILGIPYRTFTIADRGMLVIAVVNLCWAVLIFGEAWLISLWVYRTGPIHGLQQAVADWRGRNNAQAD